MSVNELRDYLAKYTGEGKGNAPVRICYEGDNPVDDGHELIDAVAIEKKNGEFFVVLQIE